MTNTPSIPLTADTIAALEAAASARYGIPLKYSPEDGSSSKSTPRPTSKPSTSSPSKSSKTRASKPLTDAQIRAEILKRVKRAKDGMSAADLADLIPGSGDRRTRFLNSMIKDGLLEKSGQGRATLYFLADDGSGGEE